MRPRRSEPYRKTGVSPRRLGASRDAAAAGVGNVMAAIGRGGNWRALARVASVQPCVLGGGIAVGHAGDVIGNAARPLKGVEALLPVAPIAGH